MSSKNLMHSWLAAISIAAAILVMLIAPVSGAPKDKGDPMMAWDKSNPPVGAMEAVDFANMAMEDMNAGKWMDAGYNLHLATYILEEGMHMHMGMMGGMGMGMGMMGGGMDGMGMGMMGGMGNMGMMSAPPNMPMPPSGTTDGPSTMGKNMPDKSMMMENWMPMGADQAKSLVKEAIDALNAGKYMNGCTGLKDALYIIQMGWHRSMMMGSGMGMGMMHGMGDMKGMEGMNAPKTTPAPPPAGYGH
jgi:hypothetical protein